jgi:integrase
VIDKKVAPRTALTVGALAHEDWSNVSSSKPIPGITERHARSCAKKPCTCKPTYQAHVFDKRSNKRLRKTFDTKTAAKLWRQDAIVALRRGWLRAPRDGERRVGAALDELIAGMRDGSVLDRSGRRYRPSTVRNYEADIRKRLHPLVHLRLSEVRRADVQRLVDQLHAEGLSGSTVRNKIEPLRVLYRRAVQDEEATTNPTTQLRWPALATGARRIADPDRAGRLLDALPDSERALWTTAFYAGLRMGELRALRWRDVDFDAGLIRVVSGWDDKEGEQDTKTAAGHRTVPLVGRLRAELARHKLATGRTEDELCFGSTAHSAPFRSTIRSRALKAWGWKRVPNPDPNARPKQITVKTRDDALEPLTPHEARHTCASYLAAAGLTHKEVQTAMGHADIRTTLNLYAKAVPGWEQGAATKIDAYLESARQLRDS